MSDEVLKYVVNMVSNFCKHNPLVDKVFIGGSAYLILKSFSIGYPNDIDIMVDLRKVQNRQYINMVFDPPVTCLYPATEISRNMFLLHPVDKCITIFNRVPITVEKYRKWVDYFFSLPKEFQGEILHNLLDDNPNKVLALSHGLYG